MSSVSQGPHNSPAHQWTFVSYNYNTFPAVTLLLGILVSHNIYLDIKCPPACHSLQCVPCVHKHFLLSMRHLRHLQHGGWRLCFTPSPPLPCTDPAFIKLLSRVPLFNHPLLWWKIGNMGSNMGFWWFGLVSFNSSKSLCCVTLFLNFPSLCSPMPLTVCTQCCILSRHTAMNILYNF